MPDKAAFGFNTPFIEQLDFFKRKLNLPSERWDDITRAAHDRAFIVAGAMKADLLDDLNKAVTKAIEQGKGLEEFRKDFAAIVQKHGWTGWTGEGSAGGEAWRTRVIYQTNLATSYAAGRYKQLTDPEFLNLRPYWRYVHNDSVMHPRPLHQAWGNMRLTLRYDHPFWKTHFPPNGWGCMCRVTPVEAPLDGDATDPPDGWGERDSKGNLPGIDKGFDYAPGASVVDEMRGFVQAKVDKLPKVLGTDFAQSAEKILADTPAMLDAAKARAVVTSVIGKTFTAEDFSDFAKGLVKGERPIAFVPPDVRAIVDAVSDVLLFSQDTAIKQFLAHPDISASDYLRVQSMLDRGELWQDKDSHLGMLEEQGKWFYAVIKATKTGKAVYLQSLRRTNDDDITAIRARSRLVRAAK